MVVVKIYLASNIRTSQVVTAVGEEDPGVKADTKASDLHHWLLRKSCDSLIWTHRMHRKMASLGYVEFNISIKCKIGSTYERVQGVPEL